MPAELLGTLKTGSDVVRILCEIDPTQTPAIDATNPTAKAEQWIHVLPHGPLVEARDGRKFSVEKMDEIVRRTEVPMLVDWEHKSETSDDTRAAGWIEELKVQADGIWGRVSWTPIGREQVATRQFRFLSPVVLGRRANSSTDKRAMFSVERFASVALTNKPALKMHGIEMFREKFAEHFGPFTKQEGSSMDKIKKALCAAYGLPEDADDDAMVTAITAKKPSTGEAAKDALALLTEERNEARESLAAMQAELKTFREKSFSTEVHAFFDQGGREGKIPPASREKWLATALKSPEHFAMFKDDIYPGLQPSATTAAPAPGTKAAKLKGTSAQGVEYDALKQLGLTDKQIRESEAEVFNIKGQVITDAGDDDDDDETETEPAGTTSAAQGG